MNILWMSFSLFLLMDSIGNIPIFIALLKDIPPKREKWIILRELIIALTIIIIFFFIGEPLLSALKVQQYSVLIAGGVILFLIAIKMIFPTLKNGAHEQHRDKEPFIVPMAVPLIAGPAVLAAVMLYSHEQTSRWLPIGAILIAWAASTIVLISASILKKWLGWRGITACERLMGLLLTLIAVQMFLEGVSLYTAR
ncbi:MAG TPA: MarC family protein [Rhabdochlamydiaceae bacterium]|nr:MarC family protein [Rhabdochlamydiaceae bacterium]